MSQLWVLAKAMANYGKSAEFYILYEVGSVIATVTENLGGANQTVTLTSYDAWGKARATTGCVFHRMPVSRFTSWRSGISPEAGHGFHRMAVAR